MISRRWKPTIPKANSKKQPAVLQLPRKKQRWFSPNHTNKRSTSEHNTSKLSNQPSILLDKKENKSKNSKRCKKKLIQSNIELLYRISCIRRERKDLHNLVLVVRVELCSKVRLTRFSKVKWHSFRKVEVVSWEIQCNQFKVMIHFLPMIWTSHLENWYYAIPLIDKKIARTQIK